MHNFLPLLELSTQIGFARVTSDLNKSIIGKCSKCNGDVIRRHIGKSPLKAECLSCGAIEKEKTIEME